MTCIVNPFQLAYNIVTALKTSLTTLIRSFHAEECRGYHQGKGACKAWIYALAQDSDFRLEADKENVLRRLVNHSSSCELAYNTINASGVSTPELRKEQLQLLENALALDKENCRLAELILEMLGLQGSGEVTSA